MKDRYLTIEEAVREIRGAMGKVPLAPEKSQEPDETSN